MKLQFTQGVFWTLVLCLFWLPMGCQSLESQPPAHQIHFENSYFYDTQGNFDPDKAKDAYISIMRYHGYPVFQGIKEKLWVTDYGAGQFTKVGLGAVFFINNEEDRYMLLDLYLLPRQMLAEHWHVKTEKNPAKLEGWLVRHGQSHIVGIGIPNLSDEVVIPKCHRNGTVTVHHETLCHPGDFVKLQRVGSRHWQYGGPEGAIVTEVATVHDGAGVRHSDPAINDYFLSQ